MAGTPEILGGSSDVPFKMDFRPEGLVESVTDCLNFSNVFTLAGFETMNDKLLLEMNERAKQQRLEAEAGKSEKKPELGVDLGAFAKMTRSPPGNRFSAAHGRAFASSPSIQSLPIVKRSGSGEESPSKRRRAPGGAAIGIRSPTKPLQSLSLTSNESLEEVSLARQREKQRRDLQTSPRRRLPRPRQTPLPKLDLHAHKQTNSKALTPTNLQSNPLTNSQSKAPISSQNKAQVKLQERPLLRHPESQGTQGTQGGLRPTQGFCETPRLRRPDLRKPDLRKPDLKPQVDLRHNRPLPSPPRHAPSAIPRSRSTRGLAEPGERSASNHIPSYARPTQATLRRSQSVNHTLNNHTRPKS